MSNKKCKTILILNGNMNRGGGTEKMTQILADSLCEDYEVHILSMQPCEKSYYKVNDNVTLHSLEHACGIYGMLRSFIQLYSLVKKIKADTLISVDVFLSIYSIPIKLLLHKVKVISWEQFSIENDMGLSWCRYLRSFALKHSNYYVCLTSGDKEAFKKQYRFKTPIDYINNPYETQKRKVIYDAGAKKIVTAGNFFEAKGIDLAVAVADIVLQKHPEWRWYIYGDGPEMYNILKMINANKLDDKVILPGRVTNIDEIYSDSSIYVMTSRTEGFGLVLLEAQSFKLPTVAFDVPYGPRSIITHEKNGYLISPFNIEEMAAAINNLIENQSLRQSFSDHSQDDFDKFSIDVFKSRWLSIISSL